MQHIMGEQQYGFKIKDFQRALSDAKEAAKLKPTNRKYEDLLFKIKSSMNPK